MTYPLEGWFTFNRHAKNMVTAIRIDRFVEHKDGKVIVCTDYSNAKTEKRLYSTTLEYTGSDTTVRRLMAQDTKTVLNAIYE